MLRQGVQGISDIITMPGLINQDFADVRAIMKDAGSALMGIGRASGENRAVEAAREAIASPLLELDINGAQGILWNITGSANLSLFEVQEAAEAIKEAADPEANIIFGTSFNERLGEEVMVTVIATGFDGGRKRHTSAREATGVMDTSASIRQPRERDFLEELQRQRDEVLDGPIDGGAGSAASPRRPPSAAPRSERSVGEPAPRQAPPDLRRGRPGDPQLPPPEVAAGGDATGSTTRPDRPGRARARGVLERIADACARAGRDPAGVTLVAVSKTVDAARLRRAVAAGLTILGENRVQEGEAKAPEVPGASWQLVGPLQSNKARRALEVFDADPDGRLGRARRAPRPAGRARSGRAPATRSWSRSTSTPTRPRPASRPTRWRRRCRRCWSCRTSRSAG